MLEAHIAGRLIADGGDRSPKDVIVQIFARNAVQESFIVPAVAEPLIVWILKGSATVEERDIGGDWLASDVHAGDFFLTDSDEPYELRWRSHDGAPFEVMHLYLGLPLLERAMQEVHGTVSRPVLRDVSGVHDAELGLLIEILTREISGQTQPSSLLLESIAQAVSIHLVRGYVDPERSSVRRRSAIPAYRLRRVTDLMQQNLASEFDLGLYARGGRDERGAFQPAVQALHRACALAIFHRDADRGGAPASARDQSLDHLDRDGCRLFQPEPFLTGLPKGNRRLAGSLSRRLARRFASSDHLSKTPTGSSIARENGARVGGISVLTSSRRGRFAFGISEIGHFSGDPLRR